MALIAAALLLSPALAQEASVFYVYDEIGRLTAVVDQQGDGATYTYDAVGNLLRIERFDAVGAVAITLVAPNRGRAGTIVEIFGTGFSSVPAENTVSFNGTPAVVSAAAPNRLLTGVPVGATTGHIAVTSPLGAALSPGPFRVPGEMAVSPANATVLANGAQQFEALENGVPTTSVRWTVNGFPGGEPSIGTITPGGLFQAPAVAPPPAVTIEAVDLEDPSVTASAVVNMLPPMPAFLASRPVSVAIAEPTLVIAENVATRVSARIAEPLLVDHSLVGSISIRVDPADRFAIGAIVAVAREPIVTAVSPATGVFGTTVSVAITGVGLGTTSALVFLRNNAADSTIAAGNLSVNSAGTEMTVDITIDAGAHLGSRVIQVVTAEGISTAAASGGNLFTVE